MYSDRQTYRERVTENKTSSLILLFLCLFVIMSLNKRGGTVSVFQTRETQMLRTTLENCDMCGGLYFTPPSRIVANGGQNPKSFVRLKEENSFYSVLVPRCERK